MSLSGQSIEDLPALSLSSGAPAEGSECPPALAPKQSHPLTHSGHTVWVRIRSCFNVDQSRCVRISTQMVELV